MGGKKSGGGFQAKSRQPRRQRHTFPRRRLDQITSSCLRARFRVRSVHVRPRGSRLDPADRPLWPVLALTLLLTLGLAKSLYEDRDSFSWRDFEEIARKVNQVTSAHSSLLADEHIYFLTRRPPPSGMECDDSHKLALPPALAASLHIVPRTELNQRIKAGMFSVVETCEDEDEIKNLGLLRLYAQKAEIAGCNVFWDKVPAH